MAHYAWLDKNNIVINVSVGVDENETIEGLSVEDWCSRSTGYKIVRTSYNAKIRKKYAAIGDTYDAVRDAFIAPKPDNATGFDETTCQWIVPDDGNKL
jgi:hypothetical protein